MDATENKGPKCKHCGGPIAIRNPTGNCDHLYFPDLLTDEAKRANGCVVVMRPVWEMRADDAPTTDQSQ